MADIKLTKNALKAEQARLHQLKKYLPILQLKKAMLQAVVHEARQEREQQRGHYEAAREKADRFSGLLTGIAPLYPQDLLKIVEIKKHYENIAGVEVPYFEKIEFAETSYGLFETAPWFDAVLLGLQELVQAHVQAEVAEEKAAALENELRQVSIRVNLFEKVLIPRALKNIKKIRVFLGDLQLSSIGQMKAVKAKIEEKKEALLLEEEEEGIDAL